MEQDAQGKHRHKRLISMVCVGLFFLVPVRYVVYAANNMPDVEAAAEITTTGGTYQRDSIAPALCVLADGWVMEYGPVIWVWLSGPLTKTKMAVLVKLGHLEELTVISHHNKDQLPEPSEPTAWSWFAKLSTLRQVCFIQTDITDADLVNLYQLRLQQISLWDNPNLTAAGVDRLRRALPNAHINYR